MNPDYVLTLAQITGPDFVGGIETDGATIRKAAILKDMVGMTAAAAREHIRVNGWKAALITSGAPGILQNEESFEVLKGGKRAYFYFDDVRAAVPSTAVQQRKSLCSGRRRISQSEAFVKLALPIYSMTGYSNPSGSFSLNQVSAAGERRI